QLLPEIAEFCDIECHDIMNVDSSNLQPSDWMVIVNSIKEHVNREMVDGIVVTHGTDTMAFTASATAILLRNLGKPVVFTGSQIPLPLFGSDARNNLIDAIRVAATMDLAESVICFNNVVYRSCRTVKMREYDLSAFETVDPFPMAEIAREIDIIDPFITRRKKSKSWVDGELNPKVALIRAFPGMSPEMLRMLPKIGYEGVVIEGFGAGNLAIIGDNSLIDPIRELTASGFPVVLTSQCVFGRTELLLYQTGKNFLDVGVISGFDMISEVALIKLMWALAKSRDMDEITALMHTNLAKEINPSLDDIQ
ncbi:MAG: asparaginase, partial [Candidatus Kariarchaeaceae archaeon]